MLDPEIFRYVARVRWNLEQDIAQGTRGAARTHAASGEGGAQRVGSIMPLP
jgi:hypothetical protein